MTRRFALACAVLLACPLLAQAEAPSDAKQQPVVGTWQGMLSNGMGGQLRVVLKVDRNAEGALTATMDSPDQNATGIPVAKISVEAQKVSLDVAAVTGSYEGTLDPQKNEITGTWKQVGQTLPLVFKKEVSKPDAAKK